MGPVEGLFQRHDLIASVLRDDVLSLFHCSRLLASRWCVVFDAELRYTRRGFEEISVIDVVRFI